MRRAIVASSSCAEGSSACGMAGTSSSSSRRRSTARPSRMLSALITVPTAVSMKTGAIASWITPAISGTWGSNATPAVYGTTRLLRAGRLDRAGRRRRAAAGAAAGLLLGLLLRLHLLLLLVSLARLLVLAGDRDRGAGGDHAGEDPLRFQPGAEEVEHARVEPDGLKFALALERQPVRRCLLLHIAAVERQRDVDHHPLRLLRRVVEGDARGCYTRERCERRQLLPAHGDSLLSVKMPNRVGGSVLQDYPG